MNTQVRLLGARRFMPLFATQTLGAFNDNLFKSAFVMLVTYGTARRGSFDPGVLAALAGGALIVARHGDSDARALAGLRRSLRECAAQVVGILLRG